MSPGTETPDGAPERLVEMSADVRVAVLADPAGGLVAAGGIDRSRARSMAGLAHELLAAADSAGQAAGGLQRGAAPPFDAGGLQRGAAPPFDGFPTEQVEAQTGDGSVFVVRDADYILACVARRLALPALVLYDMRQTLAGLGGHA